MSTQQKRLTAFAVLLLAGCSSASINSYVDPALGARRLTSLAVLPLRNGRLAPTQGLEITRDFTSAVHRKDPDLRILGPAAAADSLNAAGLTDSYATFLRDYATSGIPDRAVLRNVGAALRVDAIMQGEILSLAQRDGHFGVARGRTVVTISVSLFDAQSGTLLWQGTSTGDAERTTTAGAAPPVADAIQLAEQKIIDAMPPIG